MPAYTLHCTVCDTDFSRRKAWLRHLLQPGHQDKARQEVWQWDDQMKECILVVFSSFPIACDAVLKHFSKGLEKYENIVTDFVWFPNRPRVGFLQFESRSKVKHVCDSGKDVRINNQLVQVKRAVDYLTLEWKELLPPPPPGFDVQFKTPDKVKGNPTFQTVKVKLESTPCQDKTAEKNLESNETPTTITTSPLREDFQSIQNTMTIPQDKYAQAEDLMSKLQQVIAQKHPSCQVVMFRNWYLRLWSQHELIKNTIRIFFFVKKEASRVPNSGDTVDPNYFQQLLTSASGRNVLPGVQLPKGSSMSSFFRHSPTRLYFCLITNPTQMLEVQSCQLLKYMCTFDVRVKPLLMLIKYWTTGNFLRISEVDRMDDDPPLSAEVDWLVIFFLCYKNIIPTPRQIQANPHETLMYDGVDIGFAEDLNFAEEWVSSHKSSFDSGNDFVISVIKLTGEFFLFLKYKLEFRFCFVNTKDGELINRVSFHLCKKWSQERILVSNVCKLTEDEIRTVRRQGSVKGGGVGQYYKLSKINILHPLHLKYRFPFYPDSQWLRSREAASRALQKIETLLANYFDSSSTNESDVQASLKWALDADFNKSRT